MPKLSVSQRRYLREATDQYAAQVDAAMPYLLARGIDAQTASTSRQDCEAAMGDCITDWDGERWNRPIIRANGKAYPASRYLFMQAHGLTDEDVAGLVVRHMCDNGECVNVDHLTIGTQRDNVQDSIDRNRHSAGERHGCHKVTEDDVRAIRREYVKGTSRWSPGNRKELQAKYGLSRTQILAIVHRERWAHVE